eukprot:8163958-Pyramimonas_sp.AAC.1
MQGGRCGPALGVPPLPRGSLDGFRGTLSGGGLLLGSTPGQACAACGVSPGSGFGACARSIISFLCLLRSASDVGGRGTP